MRLHPRQHLCWGVEACQAPSLPRKHPQRQLQDRLKVAATKQTCSTLALQWLGLLAFLEQMLVLVLMPMLILLPTLLLMVMLAAS
jgi:hypothetical protein